MKFGGPYRVYHTYLKPRMDIGDPEVVVEKDGFWFQLFGRAFRYRKGCIYRWHV